MHFEILYYHYICALLIGFNFAVRYYLLYKHIFSPIVFKCFALSDSFRQVFFRNVLQLRQTSS